MCSFSLCSRSWVALPALLVMHLTAHAQQTDSLRHAAAPVESVAPAVRFKIGLDVPHAVMGDYWGISVPLYAGVERQLGQHWSLTGDINAGIGVGYNATVGKGVRLTHFGASVGTRYYYSQARRQRRNKPVGALTGTYLQLQGNADFTGGYYYYYPGGPIYYRGRPSLELLWGYQRRLGQHGFFDAGAGLRLRNEEIYGDNGPHKVLQVLPVLRARVGFMF